MEKEKILSSRSQRFGNLSESQKEVARYINENPTFDIKKKEYTYIKNFKTNTPNHGWIFEFNGKIFAAMQLWIHRQDEMVIIFNADQKGNFSIATNNEVVRYMSIVDIEYAVDKFVIDFKDI